MSLHLRRHDDRALRLCDEPGCPDRGHQLGRTCYEDKHTYVAQVAHEAVRVDPGEVMPDGSHRSGLSQQVVGEIVRERANAISERDRYRALLEQVDAHYSGSLDHQPPYVARIREALHA